MDALAMDAVSTINLQIPVRAQSLVIGKGRRVVTQIVDDCQVEISVPTRTEHSSRVTITGSPEHVAEAQKRIESILGYKISSEELILGLLDVPKNEQGALIGLSGSLVKELRKKCGCHIHVPRFKDKQSSVEVYGSAQSIMDAKTEIERILGHPVTVSYPTSAKNADGSTRTSASKRKLGEGRINDVVFFPLPDDDPDGIVDRIISYICSATNRLDACVAALDEPRISSAIEQIINEGVKVRILVCKTSPGYSLSEVSRLQEKGAIIAIDNSSVTSLINFVVVDSSFVLNGTHTWTKKGSFGVRFALTMTNHRDFVRAFHEKFESMYYDAVGLN